MPTRTTVRTEREQVQENTVRRANFGKTTRQPDPQRWNGVDH